ncbi:hypothetical protein BH23BAC3_BH23BAC3_32210 [soil metagenome]
MKTFISILTMLILAIPAFVQAQHSHHSGGDTDFKTEFTTLIESYLSMKDHLLESNAEKAIEAGYELTEGLEKIGEQRLEGDDHMAWMETYGAIENSLNEIQNSSDLDELRKYFHPLSEELAGAAERFGINGVVFVQHCPMAIDKEGGSWLSREEQIANPYLPDSMLRCGRVIEKINYPKEYESQRLAFPA